MEICFDYNSNIFYSSWLLYSNFLSRDESFIWKVSKYGVISGPYFPVFALNTEIHRVNLRIHSEYRKVRIRNISVFGHFSPSDYFTITTTCFIITLAITQFNNFQHWPFTKRFLKFHKIVMYNFKQRRV